jgi:prepilin-type N-terminal cleavage/methylation domain-containing protein
MKNRKEKKGFTLMEIIIVIAIMGAMVMSFLIFNSGTVNNIEVRSESNQMVEMLRLAQARAITGYGNAEWSVYLADDHYTLFKGDDYAERDTDFDTTNYLPDSQSINSILLNGSADTLTFDKNNGETENYGSFTLEDSSITKTISINQKGLIEENET